MKGGHRMKQGQIMTHHLQRLSMSDHKILPHTYICMYHGFWLKKAQDCTCMIGNNDWRQSEQKYIFR